MRIVTAAAADTTVPGDMALPDAAPADVARPAAACALDLPWRVVLSTLVSSALAAVAMLGAIVLLAHHHGVWFATLSRDPTQTAHLPFYVGFVSNFGILLWSSSTAVLLFAGVLHRGAASTRAAARYVMAFGLLSAVLTVDDLYMIHDEVFPKHLGVPEEVVTAVYLAMLVAIVLRFHRFVLRPPGVLLLMALGLFGVSVLTEYLPAGVAVKTHLLEDGAKLVGIVMWFAYALTVATSVVRSDFMGGLEGPPNPPDAHKRPGEPGPLLDRPMG